MTENVPLSRTPPQHKLVAEYHFRDLIHLQQGIMSGADDIAPEERYGAGLKLIAIHSGRVHSESDAGQQITIDSPAVFIAAGKDNYTLQNRFKAGTPLHYTLLQLSQELRLQTAFQMLTTQGEVISAVAYHVGYTPAHFSVVFRKRFGLAPGDVRKRRFIS